MKKTVLIIGTNAVGKTSLARELIKKAGGISEIVNRVTYCNDGKTALIGDYSKHKKIEGVDSFGETRFLSDLIKSVDREVVVFEGLKCGTFGLSIQQALFQGTEQLLVFLYASPNTINKRLIERSGSGIKSLAVLKQQKANLNAAIKYKEIGVNVVSFNTDNTSVNEIADEILSKIYKK